VGSADLERIRAALAAAAELVRAHHARGPQALADKSPGDPLSVTDLAVDRLLRARLQREGEGWLSEETEDDRSRLQCARVWIVDPLDGTREFLRGVPECSVSVGLAEDGAAVAGGVCNPLTGELFLGAAGFGVQVLGARAPAPARPRRLVLASRTEFERGEWAARTDASFAVQALGSTAYKLALVAAGAADATWTLHPRHEWDVAGGVALVLAAGGRAVRPGGRPLAFNQEQPWLERLFAFAAGAAEAFRGVVPEAFAT
jgi:myo-inositol-1(or 4)-monophosphatase